MQETRQRILEILKRRGQATVDELGRELALTAVTIRHHLGVLHREGLIGPPQARRKPGPGRPEHLYRLADVADEFFPKNYDRLSEAVFGELEERLTAEEMEELVEGVARRIAAQAQTPQDGGLPARLRAAVEFLNGLGYLASAETKEGQYLLHVANCPYERVARRHAQPCRIDARMIARLVGVDPRRLSQITAGQDRCTYLFPTTGDVS